MSSPADRPERPELTELERLKRRVAELERLQAAARNLFEETPRPGWVFEISTLKFVAVNRAALRLYGYTREEFLAMNILEIRSQDEAARLEAYMAADDAAVGSSGPWRHRRKDGSEILVEVNYHEFLHEGRPCRLVFVNDITSRVVAELALRESEERYREICENASDMIYTIDLAGNFTSINKAAELLTGYSREEASRMNMADVLAPEYLELARDMIRRKLDTGEPSTYELEIIAKDGRRLRVESSTRLRLRDGVPVGIQGIARDVTERRAAQQELERTNRELAEAVAEAREATELKSRFLANMSHEIRTPMNGVIGMTNLLLDTPLNPEQRDYAETVRVSAESLLTIINDILDLSAIEAGKLRVEYSEFDPRQVIHDSIRLLRERASAKKIELHEHVDPAIPPRLVGDPMRIRQVLLNLLSNAVKFTDQGRITLSAAVERQDEHAVQLRCEVADTGIGIPAEALSRIFESFVQADESTTRRFGGTGLGLAISKQLVELMSGRIYVESESGRGSKFWFVLPLTPPGTI